jgi:hypothetical protein
MANNGVMVIGQAPASSATASFSATSGTGVTMTMSAATLAGTSADVGRVLTILDTTYKFATITAFSSTTVATVTLSGGTLSGTGPFANSAIWLSNNATGSVSGYGTPLPRIVGNCYATFPANAISSGSAAGWRWMNFSSATVGQVYNNTYSSGQPAVVSSPTAYSTTGPGAFTQSTNGPTPARVLTMPANPGINASIETSMIVSVPNNGNTKTFRATIAGTRYGMMQISTVATAGTLISLTNQGVANSQIYITGSGANAGDYSQGTAQSPTAPLAIDTTNPQTVGDVGYLATATDYIIAERLSIKLYPTSP